MKGKQFLSGQSILKRIFLFLIPFGILLIFAFLQILNLMIFQSEKFKTQADTNRVLKEKVFPPRGLIYDTKGRIIVDNFIRQDLVITPNFIDDYSKYLSLIDSYSLIPSVLIIEASTPSPEVPLINPKEILFF